MITTSALENSIKTFVSMSEADVKQITEFFKPVNLKKGDYFIRSGRYCDVLGFIQAGYIRVFIDSPDREVTQWVSSPGYFITDLSSFISQAVGRWNMQALTDCSLLSITKTQYEILGKQISAWNDLDRQFIVKCFTMMEDRIFNHLYMSSEERFQHLMKTQSELFNIVPLHYLASMLGMTPETLSRLRKKQIP
jgi:CRP/FNR family transcriptional regulator, anaerobic regulatory protein